MGINFFQLHLLGALERADPKQCHYPGKGLSVAAALLAGDVGSFHLKCPS